MQRCSVVIGDRCRVSAGAARPAGFSLVELMVAIALSLLLLTGVVALFSNSRVSYEATDQLSRIQETGRFALDQVSRHIRSAGFSGCARQPTNVSTSLNLADLLPWNFLEGPVRGYEASGTDTWSPTLDASVQSPLSGSDVLVVRGPRLDAEPLQVQTSMVNAEDPLVLANANTGVQPGDVAMAYSCEAQSFFHVNSFSGGVLQHTAGGVNTSNGSGPGNSSATIGFPFRADAEVVPVETVIYYVRASDDLPAGTTSLWRRVGSNAAEELVQGVEQMQLRFGVDTSGDRVVDDYLPANAITNWQQVVGVTVALLVRSVEQYGTDTDQRTYDLLGTPVAAPGDRRQRQVFTATTSIRNRVRVD
jgi:type IV pilus assembly protein PilW